MPDSSLEPIQARRPSALILAAGRGSRLGALTTNTPKCLARVGGRSLIGHQLDVLAGEGVVDITVVTGYRAEAVRSAVGGRARFVHNPYWRETNSLFSMWLAGRHVADDIIVLNCDVLAHPGAIRRVIEAGPNSFAIDRLGGLGEEEMHVALDGSRLLSMSKDLDLDIVDGENVGIVRMAGATLTAVYAEAHRIIGSGNYGAWMAAAIDRVAGHHYLQAVDISDLPWVEVDFPEDLNRAVECVWPAIRVLTEPLDVAVGGAQVGALS